MDVLDAQTLGDIQDDFKQFVVLDKKHSRTGLSDEEYGHWFSHNVSLLRLFGVESTHDGKERRSIRIPLQLDVSYSIDSTETTTRTLDMSAGGFAVAFNEDVSPSNKGTVTFSDAKISLPFEVRWVRVEEGRIGCQFTEIDTGALEKIESVFYDAIYKKLSTEKRRLDDELVRVKFLT